MVVARPGVVASALILGAGLFTSAEPPAADLPSRELPAAVDLRPSFARRGLEVRRQGARGTCSVFVVAGALEYAVDHPGPTATRLSVEFLNWAANQRRGDTRDGAFFHDLWRGFARYGVCPEAEMPYRRTFDAQLAPEEPILRQARAVRDAGLQPHWIKRWDVTTGLSQDELWEIKRALAGGWPVCGGLRWPKQQRWQNGMLQMAPPEGVYDGHSVLLIGFRDTPGQNGGGVFLFRDSARGSDDGCLTYEYVLAYMNDALWIESQMGGSPGGPAATAALR